MEQPTTVGIDLAKEVFAICVPSAHGAVIETRTNATRSVPALAGQLARGAGGHGSMQQRPPLGPPAGGGWKRPQFMDTEAHFTSTDSVLKSVRVLLARQLLIALVRRFADSRNAASWPRSTFPLSATRHLVSCVYPRQCGG